MRLSIFFKALVTVFVVVFTSSITSKIVAQFKTTGIEVQQIRVQTNVVETDQQLAAVVRQQNKGTRTLASDAMIDYEVSLNENGILVLASASISDPRKYSYVWQVRIIDKDSSKEVFSKSYNDQVFSLPESNTLNPVFRDVIQAPLPNGEYAVETSIFKITPKHGIEAMNNPDIAPFLRSPRGVHSITIAN